MGKPQFAIIGLGKISQDQHVPVIGASDAFELAAIVSTRGMGHGGVPVFKRPCGNCNSFKRWPREIAGGSPARPPE